MELVDEIIFKTIVDNRNIINIMLESIMNKLDLKISHKIVMKVRLIDERPSQPLDQICDLYMRA